MKQNSTKTKAQSQNRQGFGDAMSGLNRSIIRIHPECMMLPIAPLFGQQGRGREGPPGMVRCPGNKFKLLIPEPVEGNPDYQPAILLKQLPDDWYLSLSKMSKGSKIEYKNEYQYFNTKTKNKFFNTINF